MKFNDPVTFNNVCEITTRKYYNPRNEFHELINSPLIYKSFKIVIYFT